VADQIMLRAAESECEQGGYSDSES
jgi:hypothetical protein